MKSHRIGVFYDGNFLLHASNYYNYIHPVKRRLSVSGHYFRGRLNAAEAAQRGNQLYNDRVFDDILMAEGVHAHYLPLRNLQGKREERGIDVWLSLEVFELVMMQRFDTVVLIVADTDYVPLLRKLQAYGVRVMLLSWEFEYTNDEGVHMTTKTSHELLTMAAYPVGMHEVIECGLEQHNPLICDLFVPGDNNRSVQNEPSRQVSEILSLKNGFGFIRYPNNNLFFHSQDVIGDFYDLAVGDSVEFVIEQNAQKQDVAKCVKKIQDRGSSAEDNGSDKK